MKADITLAPAAAYGSDAWCAITLGRPLSWFKANRAKLEAEGFPKVDPLIGLSQKVDVDAWIVRRRQVSNDIVVETNHHTTTVKEHLNVL
jgi:hypothetical protein